MVITTRYKKYLALVWLVSAFTVFAKEIEWLNISTIQSQVHKYQLIQLDNINTDIDIKVVSDNQILSIQNNALKRANSEYIVIEPSENLNKFHIYIRATSFVKFKVKVEISNRFLDEGEIKEFQSLQDTSVLWFGNNKENQLRAIKIIENHISKSDGLSSLYQSKLYLNYFWMLYEKQEYSKILKVINNIQIENTMDLNIKNNFIWIKALSLLNTGKFDQSSKVFQSLLLLLNEPNNNSVNSNWDINKEEIRAGFGLSLALKSYHANQQILGKKELLKALSNVEMLGDYQLISKILYFLSSLHGFENDWENAIATLDIAEEYVRLSKTKENLFMIYNQKAMSYLIINKLGLAQDYLRKAINEVADDAGYFKSGLYTNLAVTYEMLGDYSRAIRYQLSSLDVYTKNNQKHEIAISRNALGRLERSRGEFDKAISYHLLSINQYESNSLINQIDSLIELSLDYLESDELDLSKKYASIALILDKSQSILDELEIFNKQIEEYSYLKTLTDNEIDSILIELLELGIHSKSINEFNATKTLAHIALKTNNQEKYLAYEKSMNQLYDFNLVPINHQLDYYTQKLNYLSAKGDIESIVRIADEALDLVQQTRLMFDVSDLSLYWTHSAQSLLDKYINVLISRININSLNQYELEGNNLDKIFGLLEKYYAINLREKRLNSVNSFNNKLSIEAGQALNNYLSLERNSLLSPNKALQMLADEAKEQLLMKKTDEASLFDKAVLNEQLNYLDIKQVQEQLSDGELLVRYFISDDMSIAYLIDRNNKFIVWKLPNKVTIEKGIKKYLEIVKNKQDRRYVNASDLLLNIFPTEMIVTNNYRKLIIIPDGALNLLPFGAINISKNEVGYLSLTSQLEIVRTYSITDYLSKLKVTEQNNDSITVFANPVFLKNVNSPEIQSNFAIDNKLWEFNSLPYTKLEGTHILDIFHDFNINILTEKRATNENLLSRKTRNSNILHIATHGVFNNNDLDNVGLVTSVINEVDELAVGFLSLREILYNPFRANLVVVSGCETSLGKHINGEGFNSLSRGFLSQGVGVVIGTIWSVPDRATSFFMKEFYTHLRDMNGNVSKALNTTKLNFATKSQFRRYRHPYYWAGFVLTSSNRGISENIFN